MEIFKIVALSLSGLLLAFAGGSRLKDPVKNYAKNSGIMIPNDVNSLNEARSIGSLMVLGGVTILLGIAVPLMRPTSIIVATLIFFGFAIGRALSLRADGKPNPKLIQGLLFELIFGSLNAVSLLVGLLER